MDEEGPQLRLDVPSLIASPFFLPRREHQSVLVSDRGLPYSKAMDLEPRIELLDEILEEWRPTIGADFDGYRNHCTRVLQFCFALGSCGPDQRKKAIIAAAFHDIGIWIDDTVDYIPPSITPAQAYLAKQGLSDWSEEVTLLITEHHKIRPYTDLRFPLVEQFRKADLIDFSWGLFRFGLPRTFIKDAQASFPNAGFHRGLMRRAAAWFLQHPLNPAPMMKW